MPRKGSRPTASDGRAGRDQDDGSNLPSTAGRAASALGAFGARTGRPPWRSLRQRRRPSLGRWSPLRIGASPNFRPPCPRISRPYRRCRRPMPMPAGSPAPGHHAVPLCLADAIRRSLANVETVRANVAVRTAQVAQFDALKEFVPLVTMPQLLVGFNQFTPGSGHEHHFSRRHRRHAAGGPARGEQRPAQSRLARLAAGSLRPHHGLADRRGGNPCQAADGAARAPLAGGPGDPGLLRSQADSVRHPGRPAGRDPGPGDAGSDGRKLLEKQAHDVELSQARVDESRARVLLSDLEKNSRIAQRQLAVVLHQSRLLVPQERGPLPIELDEEYGFDLDDPDLVDLAVVPDFPSSRDEAIQLAKRQRVEVRILVVGLRIARLRQKRDWLGLLGKGILPAELSFKNTTPANGGVALGAIFGMAYAPTLGGHRSLGQHPPGPAGCDPVAARPGEVADRRGQRCGELLGPLAASDQGMGAAGAGAGAAARAL